MSIIKEKIKLKHILLMIIIAIGIIFISSDSYAATSLEEMGKLTGQKTNYYNYNVAGNIGTTWSSAQNWGLVACVDHYTTVRRKLDNGRWI